MELNERIDLLMDENSLLLEQKLILAEEVDKLQNQVQANNETIRSLQKNLKSTSTELQEMRKRFEMIEGDRDGAANEAMKYSESLGRIERENDEYRDQIAVLKQRCHESDLIVQELKKQLEQTSRFGEVESYNTVKRVKIAEERTRELQNLLHRKSVEFENISDANRKLRLEYQNTRQDAEGMLQVMSGLERQLNEYSIRETEVDRQAKESREKFEEALSIIEQVSYFQLSFVKYYIND